MKFKFWYGILMLLLADSKTGKANIEVSLLPAVVVENEIMQVMDDEQVISNLNGNIIDTVNYSPSQLEFGGDGCSMKIQLIEVQAEYRVKASAFATKIIPRRITVGRIDILGCQDPVTNPTRFTFNKWMEILTFAIKLYPSPNGSVLKTISFKSDSDDFRYFCKERSSWRVSLDQILEGIEDGYSGERHEYFKTTILPDEIQQSSTGQSRPSMHSPFEDIASLENGNFLPI